MIRIKFTKAITRFVGMSLPLQLLLLMGSGQAPAQTPSFQSLAPLYFTMQTGGQNPLPQVLTIVSTGKDFQYSPAQAQTTSGGNWLLLNNCGGYNYTPTTCSIAVDGTKLAPGVYKGQVTFTSTSSSAVTLLLPVTFTVASSAAAWLSGAPGGLTFVTGAGNVASTQTFPIVNGGFGTLNWTAAAGTVTGKWLNLSAVSGTAPSQMTVSIAAQGLAPGIYAGQILLQSGSGNVSIPVTLTVVDTTVPTFAESPALSFMMPEGGYNPLPAILPRLSTGNDFQINPVQISTASGGNWLSAPGCTGYANTRSSCEVVIKAATLSAGTYTGQLVFINYTANTAPLIVPVTLYIVSTDQSIFTPVPGGLTFTAGNGAQLQPQTIPIDNAGAGTLKWSVTASVNNTAAASNLNWINLSSISGTGPASLAVSVNPQGLTPGSYSGQVTLTTASGTVAIPVSLVITSTSSAFFQQSPALSFTMNVGGSNPLPQAISLATTAIDFQTIPVDVFTGSGGSWLKTSGCSGYQNTPFSCFVTIDAATLPAGTYLGQLVFYPYNQPYMPEVISVTLKVVTPDVPSFGGITGGLNFVSGNGFLPVPQNIVLTNAGAGTLNWTATSTVFQSIAGTAANWITLSSASGTAPSTVTVNATPAGLPPGTYLGQIQFSSPTSSVTVPVRLVILDNVTTAFQQVASYAFTMNAGGLSPLSQVLQLSDTGSGFTAYLNGIQTATGGNWLSLSNNSGYPSTPFATEIQVDGSKLGPGVYTGQIVYTTNNNPIRTLIVSVTLTVLPSGQPAFGGMPGQLNFVSGNGFTPSAQTVQVTNVNGLFNWTASTSISRTLKSGTGNWLSLSATSGDSLSTFNVSVSPAGLGPGTYLGQVLLQAGQSAVSIPVTLTVLDTTRSVFQQATPLTFTMTPGGPNPASAFVTVKGTGAALNIREAYYQTGGGWLKMSGCTNCQSPQAYSATISATSLPAGIYQSELFVTDESTSVEIPIILTVGNPRAPVPTIAPGGIAPVYSTTGTVQPGEWISIFGTNLATSTALWNSDFPTSLAGTSVTVDGIPAYMWYASPGQLNLQVPDDAKRGPVPVTVTTANGTVTATVNLADVAPSFSLLDNKHVTGLILRSDGSGAYGGGTYDIIGPAGGSLGYPTVAAAPGDNIVLFCVGLGPTAPSVPAGQAFSGAAYTTGTVSVKINGVSVPTQFAGLSGAGLYQINLSLPANLGSGELPLIATVGGTQTPSGVVITVR